MKTNNTQITVQSRGANSGARRNLRRAALVATILVPSIPAFAQTGPPTTLPIDPSFMYTAVSTPTIAAISIAIGFAAVFMVIRYIKKGISKG